jgi:hypothetical protein
LSGITRWNPERFRKSIKQLKNHKTPKIEAADVLKNKAAEVSISKNHLTKNQKTFTNVLQQTAPKNA